LIWEPLAREFKLVPRALKEMAVVEDGGAIFTAKARFRPDEKGEPHRLP
jgi:hypothetical protein